MPPEASQAESVETRESAYDKMDSSHRAAYELGYRKCHALLEASRNLQNKS